MSAFSFIHFPIICSSLCSSPAQDRAHDWWLYGHACFSSAAANARTAATHATCMFWHLVGGTAQTALHELRVMHAHVQACCGCLFAAMSAGQRRACTPATQKVGVLAVDEMSQRARMSLLLLLAPSVWQEAYGLVATDIWPAAGAASDCGRHGRSSAGRGGRRAASGTAGAAGGVRRLYARWAGQAVAAEQCCCIVHATRRKHCGAGCFCQHMQVICMPHA